MLVEVLLTSITALYYMYGGTKWPHSSERLITNYITAFQIIPSLEPLGQPVLRPLGKHTLPPSTSLPLGVPQGSQS